MTLVETIFTIVVTNVVTFIFGYWNFRIILERRLTKLETKVDMLLNQKGISL